MTIQTNSIRLGRLFKMTSLLAASMTCLLAPALHAQDDDEGLIEEVVVYGIRSTIINSLAEKRDSRQIIDTLSSLQADKFPDRNVAEALNRLPGVSFRTEEATGLGEFISIRGLSTNYNNIQFDGVNGGSTSRNDRAVGLSGASADNVSEVRVTKALLASNDSEGIGGSVNIITRTALDTGQDRLIFGAETRSNSFVDDNGYEYNFAFSKLFGEKFGVDVSAAVDRRYVRNIQNNADGRELFHFPDAADMSFFEAGDEFDTTFNNTNGIVTNDEIEMEDSDWEADDQVRDGRSFSGSLAWQATDQTRLSLIGRYSDRESSSLISHMGLDTDDNCEVVDPALGTFDCWRSDPEYHARPDIEDSVNRHESVILKGETELDQWSFDYYASYASGEESQLDHAIYFFQNLWGDDFGGTSSRDWAMSPFTRSGDFTIPNLNSEQVAAIVTSTAAQTTDVNHEMIDDQEDERNAIGFDVEWRPDSNGVLSSVEFGMKYEKTDVERLIMRGSSTRSNICPDGSYHPDCDDRWTLGEGGSGGIYGTGETVSLADIGAPLAHLGIYGIPRADEANYREMIALFNGTFMEALAAGETDYVTKSYRKVDEEVFNAYVQAEFQFSDSFTLIAGLRFDHATGDYQNTFDSEAEVEVEALDGEQAGADLLSEVITFPGVIDPTELLYSSRTQDEWLPRLVATWRPDDHWVVRGAYTTALKRPSPSRIADINGGSEFYFVFEPTALATIDEDATLTDILALGLTIDDLDEFEAEFDIGNPELENTYSHNFDLSIEYYWNESTAITAGIFHKRIENFIFKPGDSPIEGDFGMTPESILATLELSPEGQALIDSLGGFDAILASGVTEVVIEQSKNNAHDAEVYGIELGFSTQWENLPAPWDGLGFYGNVTFLDSEVKTVDGLLEDDDYNVMAGLAQEGDHYSRTTVFYTQPDRIANASLFYDKGGLELALSYSYTGAILAALGDFSIDNWEQASERWDFTAEYLLPWWDESVSAYFRARDFTDDGDKPTRVETYGSGAGSTRNMDLTMYNGREFILGVVGRFE
jgi:iron complex outermembrane receptor protein